LEANGEQQVLHILRGATPSDDIFVLPSPGWHWVDGQESPIFAVPNGEVIGAHGEQRFELAEEARISAADPADSFEDWQTAAQAVVNRRDCPHLLLGLLAGLAGPLIQLAGLDTYGLNLSGDSSLGKTTAQKLAVSAWTSAKPTEGLLATLRTTTNATEVLAQRSCGTVLALDELGHTDSEDLAGLIYGLASGVGKARLTREVQLRQTSKWTTFAILSGEQSIGARLKMAGKRLDPGVAVRLPDVPVSGVNGGLTRSELDEIHAVLRNSGHSGPALIRAIFENGHHLEQTELRDALHRIADQFAGEGADPRLRRSALPFAACFVVGQLLSRYGILDCERESEEATRWAFGQFRESHDADALSPDERALQTLSHALADRWDGSIVQIGAPKPRSGAQGHYNTSAIFVTDQQLIELSGYGNSKQFAKYLDKRGLLKRIDDPKRLACRYVPGLGPGSYYALSRALGPNGDATDGYPHTGHPSLGLAAEVSKVPEPTIS
jgi:hypothetical protein